MKILLAWELGSNFGHLARHIPIALRLREDGHQPVFAVADTRIAETLLTPHGFRFLQAPAVHNKPQAPVPTANYGELLLAEGFGDPVALAGRVRAWLALFEIVQPDALLLDHAPTALLAARLAGLSRTVFGTGFEIPPERTPYPCFRTWEAIPAERLANSDRRALANINAVRRIHGQPEQGTLPELFQGAAKALVTLPELDHYGERPGERYLGPIYAAPGGAKVGWPLGDGKRILAYLRADIPGFQAMVNALVAQAGPAILVVPNVPAAWIAHHANARLTIHADLVEIEPLLKDCDLGVSYGGNGTLSQFLLAGIPQVVMPKNAEQYLGGKRIQDAGAGLLIGRERDVSSIARTIACTLADPGYRKASEAVAERYATYHSATSVHAVARLLAGA